MDLLQDVIPAIKSLLIYIYQRKKTFLTVLFSKMNRISLLPIFNMNPGLGCSHSDFCFPLQKCFLQNCIGLIQILIAYNFDISLCVFLGIDVLYFSTLLLFLGPVIKDMLTTSNLTPVLSHTRDHSNAMEAPKVPTL